MTHFAHRRSEYADIRDALGRKLPALPPIARAIEGIANHETDNMAWLRRAGEALRERPELRTDHIEGKDNGGTKMRCLHGHRRLSDNELAGQGALRG